MATTVLSIRGTSDSFFEISKNLDIFAGVFRTLNASYVDEIKPGELMKTGIDAMLKSLDPYTNYIPESLIEEYKFITTGQYGGIGALVRKHGNFIIVSEVYEGFPAQKAGIIAGDRILEINDNSVVGKNTEDISNFLKGEPGSTVKVILERGHGDNVEKITKSMLREEIKIKDVPYYGMLNDSIGYIILNSFTPTASKEFEKAYDDLRENQPIKSLVIDLRGNGGGLLSESVNIVNFFVERGTKVVETKGKVMENNHTYKALNNPIDTEMPIAVLINGHSASASEIVSGTIQDLDRGVIIGQRSFGKGLVQTTSPLSYNAQLKMTIAKYYIPSGRCIQKVDYSHRNEDGEADDVPDSLIATFESLKYKRPLKDGKGINPDVEVDPRTLSAIAQTLLAKQFIFDYGTIYCEQHKSIAEPGEFRLTDEDYQAFIKFLSDKDYSYETRTEILLNRLEETAKKELYFEHAKEEYATLSEKMQLDKKDDLIKFKDEIKELMEYDIVSRYYYDRGRIINSLDRDPIILQAIETLSNREQYNAILQGQQ